MSEDYVSKKYNILSTQKIIKEWYGKSSLFPIKNELYAHVAFSLWVDEAVTSDDWFHTVLECLSVLNFTATPLCPHVASSCEFQNMGGPEEK